MLVSNLQEFLTLLVPPLKAAGINGNAEKSVTTSLETLASSLAPFRDMSLDELAGLLKLTQEYRQTGQIPEWALGKKPAAQKARNISAKAPKLTPAEAIAKLQDIKLRSAILEPSLISQEIRALGALTVKDLKAVQKEFLGATSGKSKDDHLASIEKEVFSYRQSQLRASEILES